MSSVDMCEHDWPGSGCRQCFPKKDNKQKGSVDMSKIVSVYKTTDGAVFTEQTDAESHQHLVDVWDKIQEDLGCYGTVKLDYFSEFLELIRIYEENR